MMASINSERISTGCSGHDDILDGGRTAHRLYLVARVPDQYGMFHISEIELGETTRAILAFKQYFTGRLCTVLLLDDMTSTQHDLQVHSISHGVLRRADGRTYRHGRVWSVA